MSSKKQRASKKRASSSSSASPAKRVKTSSAPSPSAPSPSAPSKPQKRHTSKKNSYWGETGAYQEEYDTLWKELVPPSGKAKTKHGELLRCASRLMYEYCNNGNCNLIRSRPRTCDECEGSGDNYDKPGSTCYECEGRGRVGSKDVVLDQYYGGMLSYLGQHLLDDKAVDALTDAILLDALLLDALDQDGHPDHLQHLYDNLLDAVIFQILSSKNAPL